ncbi:MAG: hypothetical protein IT232_01975 [Flavobacteriales bacterium]|nr:hypothetical protein [Flavobacteriales bacterium]
MKTNLTFIALVATTFFACKSSETAAPTTTEAPAKQEKFQPVNKVVSTDQLNKIKLNDNITKPRPALPVE